MTESAPDVTVTALIDSLGNNDVGSITEETVRSIVAYARQGSVERSTAPVTDLGGDGVTWQSLPEPNSGIQYTLLNRFATNHLVSSGLMTGSSTEVGLTYEATPPSGTTSNAMQPRQVIVNWSIGISSSYDSLWGVSWWRVPHGSAWPSGDGIWPGTTASLDPISPLDISLFGSSLTSVTEDDYVAPQSGSITVTMRPGDMLVPALEYYGTLNATGTADPQGTLNSFIVKATMTSPVENVAAADEEATDQINPNLDTAQAAINYRAVFVGSNVDVDPTDVRKSILIRADRPTEPANGTTVYNTAAIAGGAPAKRLGVYNQAPPGGGGTASWSEFEPIQSPQSFEPLVMQNAAVTTRTGITVDTGADNFAARYLVTGKLVNVWLTCSLSTAGTAGYAIRVELPVAPSGNLTHTSTIGNASIWDPAPTNNRYHAVCEYNKTPTSSGATTYYHDCVFAITAASGAGIGSPTSGAEITIASGDGIRMQLTYFID
jgi:hypothetical protein